MYEPVKFMHFWDIPSEKNKVYLETDSTQNNENQINKTENK